MEGGNKVDDMVNAIFAKYDADNNGEIDKEEAKIFFIDQWKQSHETLAFDQNKFDGWFAKADANNDGKISREEATNFIKTLYGSN